MDMILSIRTMLSINPMPPITWVRLLRLLPALSSSATLMFVLDEHLIFGTWAHPSLQKQANAHLPAWWTKGGLRWRWVLILFYPMNYALGILNLVVTTDRHPDSTKWYMLGLGFSIAHMFFIRWALGLIADIGNNVPKGNVRRSMKGWLRMNWIRGLTTDLPAWLCFVTAALKAL